METNVLDIPDTSLAEKWINPDCFIFKERIYERCLDGTVVFIGFQTGFREKGGEFSRPKKKLTV